MKLLTTQPNQNKLNSKYIKGTSLIFYCTQFNLGLLHIAIQSKLIKLNYTQHIPD